MTLSEIEARSASSTEDLNNKSPCPAISSILHVAKKCAATAGFRPELIEPVSLAVLGDYEKSAAILEPIILAQPDFVDAAVLLAADRKITSQSNEDSLLIQPGLSASSQNMLMEKMVPAIEKLVRFLIELAKDPELSVTEEIYEAIGTLLAIFAGNLRQMGALGKSIEVLVACLKIWPSNVKAYLDLFGLLMLSRQFFPAHHLISQALDRFPNQPDLLRSQAAFFQSQVMCEELLEVCRRIHRISPGNFPDEILYRCYVPSAYLSPNEVKRYRSRALRGLRLLEQQSFIPANEFVGAWTTPSFNLAYQNANNRIFLERQASVFRKAYSLLIDGVNDIYARSAKIMRKSLDKVRIAFVSEFFRGHSNSRAFEGLLKYIDKDKFYVIILHGPDSIRDSIRDRIDDYGHESFLLPSNLGAAAKMIIDLGLHVVFYPDIGMSPSLYLLALTRIAPIQVTSWGIPHTSGIDTIDYYISGAMAEPRGAAKHYTESLQCVSGLPCCYLKELIPLKSLERQYFLLPDEQFIFGCFQNLHKLHPDFDDILEQIARNNPDALFAFVEHNHPLLTHRVLRRWEERAPSMVKRMRLLAEMNRAEFVALCNCVDVLLDPPYYGSGISFYESVHTGTPTMTLKGRYMRSRFVSGAYDLMEVPSPPVAETPVQYINLCCDLANNRISLTKLKKTISGLAKKRLYDDLGYVRDVEHLLLNAVSRIQ